MKRRAQPWLGTLVEIGIADDAGDDVLNHQFGLAFAAVAHVHRMMSFHQRDSDVSRINRAVPGELVDIDPATAEVLECALRLEDISGGLFDVGCAPLLSAWGYLPAPQEPRPAPLPASRVLQLAGDTRVEKLQSGWIDLGGIAKGYAVDAAIKALCESGVRAACVNAGGDLRVYGIADFPVAIRNPRRPTEEGARLHLSNEALATSGSYFSGRRVGRRDYSALVDTRHGQPVTRSGSASVLAPTCMLADALTKVVIAGGSSNHPALRACAATAFVL